MSALPRMPSTCRTRVGITAVELMVVLGVMITLSGLSVSGLVGNLRKARLNQAVGDLVEASNDASRMARTNQAPANGYEYGVRIGTNVSGRAYVSVVLGDPNTPSSATEVRRRTLNENLLIYRGNAPLAGDWAWFYDYATGEPHDPVTLQPIAIGSVPLGNPDHLSIRTLDNQLKRAISIYEIGIVASQEF